MSISTDKIIAIGLVVALLASIVLGANPELQTNVAVGLIGYLGRVVSGSGSSSEKSAVSVKEKITEAVVQDVMQQLTKKLPLK